MYNIGFRAHDLGQFEKVKDLAAAVNEVRERAPLQLAPMKSFPSLKDGIFSPEFASEVKANLNVSIIGCYINPIHPDEDERRRGIERFKRFLEVQKAYGAAAVGTETGSRDPDCNYHRETSSKASLETFYRSMDELMDKAAQRGAQIAIEPVAANHTICSFKRVEDLIRRYDSGNLKIIMDAANIAPLSGIPEADGSALPVPTDEAVIAYISAFMDIAGDRLTAVHVKNYVLDERGAKAGDKCADEGAINWRVLLPYIASRAPQVSFLIEGPLKDRDKFLSWFK